ncbi:MAG: class I SAM-dependent DNA methyltransferase [Acinetobacter sp.]|nr:class I SAM-dependent DNA methyltransferase [Acinetobacter sp.]
MSLGSFIKNIQNIMRSDSGINGDAQRIEQMVWLLFLKIYDAQEAQWELDEDDYQSLIPDELRWASWAVDRADGQAKTGDDLLAFVNNTLFPTLKNLPISRYTEPRQAIVKDVFEDANNYMKDGVQLRKVINEINKLDFESTKDRHAFGEIYETILKTLQSAGNAGEFYTPRAVTDFIVQMINPQIGETVADFACGTGGFLTSTLHHLEKNGAKDTIETVQQYHRSVYGVEKKPLPHLLAITNMLLHGIDQPQIVHGNALEKNVREYKESDCFDVIIMNPPYGGSENDLIKQNFPTEMRSSETADLFMALAMYRLKKNGRCAMIIPDGFLFGNDGAKTAIKQKLIKEFNLHTIIRLPASVFAPYTSITTNILFFDHSQTTDKIWFYRVDLPQNQKFSKTKPMKLEHFAECIAWWHNRVEIQDSDSESYKAKAFSPEDIGSSYNLDLCGYPTVEDDVLSPNDTIAHYHKKRSALNAKIDAQLEEIAQLIGIELE